MAAEEPLLLIFHHLLPAWLRRLTVVAIDEAAARAEIAVTGQTRWAVFYPKEQAFYVNIADPAEIVVVDARQPPAYRAHIHDPLSWPSRARSRSRLGPPVLRLRLGGVDHP